MTSYPITTIVAGALAAFVMSTFAAGLVARTGFPLPSSKRRIGCIDGLRGYLALSVLVHHFIIWMQVTRLGGVWEPPSVNLFNQFGAGGVGLFFMTTGLVFYPRILAGFRASSWLSIYTTRVFRIVPLVVVSVAIITLIIAARTSAIDIGVAIAAAKWSTPWLPIMGSEPMGPPEGTYPMIAVFWSLSYEWLFYLLVLPACALTMDIIRDRLPTWTVPLALLAGALAARVLQFPGSMLIYLPLFAIGMLAYECQCRGWIVRVLRTPAMTIFSAVSVLVGMISAQTPYTVTMPLFGFFFTCVACGNSIGGILKTKGALLLGECSYSIYLLHGALLSLLFVEGKSSISAIPTDHLPILMPLVAVAIALLATITYLLIERPAIYFGSRLAKYWTGRRLRADSPELEVSP